MRSAPWTNGSWLSTPDYASSTGGIYQSDTTGNRGLTYVGGSRELSHVVFQADGGKELAAQFLPADTSTESGDGLYEIAGLGGSSPSLRLVNVDNNGNEIGPNTAAYVGGISSTSGAPVACKEVGTSAIGTDYQAISENGETIYFTACGGSGVNTVYARIGGRETVAVSNPSPAQCTTCDKTAQPAAFQGASADGSKVFFTTTQQLVNTDSDNTMDLYEYELNNPPGTNVVQLSRGGTGDLTPGSGANVQGVLRTSEDGSHVYFVATGLLTTIPNALGQIAIAGADNLYVVDTETGETKFVADLCSNAETSGTITDSACPSTLNEETGLNGINDLALWGNAPEGVRRQAQTTPNGRYLVFTTYARLITSGPEADTDDAQDVYRYDFQTGELLRVSIGKPSFPQSQNGNTPSMNAQVAPIPAEGENEAGAMADINDWNRAISDDGELVIFYTPEQLQADDVNTGSKPSCSSAVTGSTGCDLYLWRKGVSGAQSEVSMITDGHGTTSSETEFGDAAMSTTGADIFFLSRSQLVGQDTDGLVDLYDARVNGGFQAPIPAASCSDEECQGTPTNSPAELKPEGTATQLAGANLIPSPFTETSEKPAAKPKSLTSAQKLAAALKVCKQDSSKKKRARCEHQARKKYAPSKSKRKTKKKQRAARRA
jgi:hypothetical protein